MAGSTLEEVVDANVRLRDERSMHEGFETLTQALSEDDVRAERLGNMRFGTPAERVAACRLKRELECRRGTPDTLASKRRMRLNRLGLRRVMKPLCRRVPRERMRFVTLMGVRHQLTSDQLKFLNPKSLGRRLRMRLRHCGVNRDVDGWAIFYLDLEYNPITGKIQLHWHGLAVGDVIGACRALKETPSYKSVQWAGDSPDGVAKRVVLKLITSPQDPRLISYVFKGTAYARARGQIGTEPGKRLSQARRTRIPEPHHSRILLWLDRWQLGDMAVLINLRIGKEGLYRL